MSRTTAPSAPVRPAPVPYRVRVGVTGHRSLRDPAAAAGRVREILESSVGRLFDGPLPRDPRVTPWAFTVITALAEGADRLVAWEVLRTPESEIEVLLPFPRKEYRRDFATGASRREFDELCARAGGEQAIGRVGPGVPGAAGSGAAGRGADYLRTGRAVVDRCDVLIALWDGQPARGVGGTADVVAYARERRRPLVIVGADAPHAVSVERGEPMSAGALRRTETFNTFPARETARLAYEENAYRESFGRDEAAAVGDGARRMVREALVPCYVTASMIAKRNRGRHAGAGLLAYVLSPAAVAAVALGAVVHSAALIGCAVELLLLAAVLGVVFHADRHKVHRKWIEARYVAERIRSAMFCVVCGAAPSRIGVPPWLLYGGGDEAWAFRAADEVARRVGVPPPVEPGAFEGLRTFVQRAWLDEQARYHRRRAVEVGATSRRLELAGKWTFAGALGIAGVHLALTGTGLGESLLALERPVVFLALVLPAIAASIGGIRAHREYSRLERRHQVMAGMLGHLRDRFSSAESLEEMYPLLREAEDVMLQESGEWLALMRYARIDAA
jgi:hypothetical protein